MKDVYYNLVNGDGEQWGTRYGSYEEVKEGYKRWLEEGLNPRVFIYVKFGSEWKHYLLDMEEQEDED